MEQEESGRNECRDKYPHPPTGATIGSGRNMPDPSVTITKVANGFCLQIGCKIFVAKTWVEASTGLADYWADPIAAEKKYTVI